MQDLKEPVLPNFRALLLVRALTAAGGALGAARMVAGCDMAPAAGLLRDATPLYPDFTFRHFGRRS